MPISFVFAGDDVIWTQRLDQPAVYLDTFAIRAIADSDELSERFAAGLRRRGGTLRISVIVTARFG